MSHSVVDWKIDSVAMMIAAAAAEIVETVEAERTARIRCLIISTNLDRAAAAVVADLCTTARCVFSQFLYVAGAECAAYAAAVAVGVVDVNVADLARVAVQPDARHAVGSEIQQREDSHVVVEWRVFAPGAVFLSRVAARPIDARVLSRVARLFVDESPSLAVDV